VQFKQNFARVAEAQCPVVNQDGMQRGAELSAAERAAADFLTALGIDIDREERRATPARMARAYAELLAVRPFRLTADPRSRAEFFALARVPTPPGPM
jgi:GTP cyclohydrolase I